MDVNVKVIKRKLLVKYPTFGSTMANLDFQEENRISTLETDGKKVLYNPEFLGRYSIDEQVFLFAHEVSHVILNHLYRSEGKDKELWNIATDGVINANLKKDGLKMPDEGIDIPGAENYDAETIYEKLLEEKQQSNQQNDGNESNNNNQEQAQNSQEQTNNNAQMQCGPGSHDLWDKAIEDRKKEQQKIDTNDDQKGSEEDVSAENASVEEINEKDFFEQCRIERKKQLEELTKDLSKRSSQEPGSQLSTETRTLADIGIAKTLIDWRKLLRQAVKYNEEYTRKNARMRNGYFTHRLEQIPIPETEIVLDVSGSVSEDLLRNFLRECKNIIENSKVKVGCFDSSFHGFTEIRKTEDIDKLNFPIGGGTDFNAAVGAFSKRIPNKIIFTDGKAPMPEENVRNVIWVVYGDKKINPKGGKVINITGEQLERLYQKSSRSNQHR